MGRSEERASRGEALAFARSVIPFPEARLLLEHVLGISRAALIAHPESLLSDAESAAFRQMVGRRQKGEPVAYLLGEREFFGRKFGVAPGVLIPRPETELLVELSLERVGKDARILDMGTGSGAVAVTLALESPGSRVTATDASAGALAVAEENARVLGAFVRFLQGDWYGALPAGETFDLVVSNPPYVAPGDSHLGQGDLRFEPVSALVGAGDGLGDICRIVTDAAAHLVPGGWLLFEHGYDQGAASRSLLEAAGFAEIQTWRDLAGVDRVSGGRKIESRG